METSAFGVEHAVSKALGDDNSVRGAVKATYNKDEVAPVTETARKVKAVKRNLAPAKNAMLAALKAK